MSARQLGGWQGARIVWDLGWSEFRLKYRGSVLGYFWSLAAPMAKFAVFLYVFQVIFPVDIPGYPLYLFLGIIVWEYFTNITTACIGVPLTYEHIIQKVAFPRFLLVLTVGWLQTIIFCTHVLIFVFMGLFLGPPSALGLLFLPVICVQTALLSLGIGSLLASYSLRFRDFPHLWNIALQMLFWLTPVAYGHAVRASAAAEFLDILSSPGKLLGWEALTTFVRFQPLSLIIFDARRVLLSANAEMPTFVHSVALTAICMAIFIAGYIVFRRRSRYFIQEY